MMDFARQLYQSLISYETRMRIYKLRHPGLFERKRHAVHEHPKGRFSLKAYDEHRCIFVHITKTAGTAVATAIFGYLPYHYTAVDYRVIFGRRSFDEYYKFAFARNPWDRLYSAWRYLRAGGWDDEDQRWYQENLAGYGDFGDFVRGWLREDRLEQHVHFWPQYRFLCDGAGRMLVDDIYHFETLDRDFASITQRLGIDAHLEPRNTNPGRDYREVYDDETREIVSRVYSRDIELLGYDFDGIARRTGPAGR